MNRLIIQSGWSLSCCLLERILYGMSMWKSAMRYHCRTSRHHWQALEGHILSPKRHQTLQFKNMRIGCSTDLTNPMCWIEAQPVPNQTARFELDQQNTKCNQNQLWHSRKLSQTRRQTTTAFSNTFQGTQTTLENEKAFPRNIPTLWGNQSGMKKTKPETENTKQEEHEKVSQEKENHLTGMFLFFLHLLVY